MTGLKFSELMQTSKGRSMRHRIGSACRTRRWSFPECILIKVNFNHRATWSQITNITTITLPLPNTSRIWTNRPRMPIQGLWRRKVAQAQSNVRISKEERWHLQSKEAVSTRKASSRGSQSLRCKTISTNTILGAVATRTTRSCLMLRSRLWWQTAVLELLLSASSFNRKAPIQVRVTLKVIMEAQVITTLSRTICRSSLLGRAMASQASNPSNRRGFKCKK